MKSSSPRSSRRFRNIKFNILESEKFKLTKYDIITSKTLSISEAILGGKIIIETVQGPKIISLKRGIQNNDELHVEGEGVPHDFGIGKLKVRFNVKIPTKLKPAQEELIIKFKNLEGEVENIDEYEEIQGKYVKSERKKPKLGKKKDSM